LPLALPLPPAASLAEVKAWATWYRLRTGHKPRLFVSFSGGRTSALMSKRIKDELSEYFELLFVFANTGREHPDTLRFVDAVDRNFGLNLVWIEGEVQAWLEGTRSIVVNYVTARQQGEPFEEVVAKYGLPNQTFKHCTRELKTNPMHHYVREVQGWETDYLTAVGIRADESRRVRDTAIARSIVYPLTHWWPLDKQDVLTYWEDFDWDLAIPEHWGNCIDCHKKSDRKLAMLAREDLSGVFEFSIKLDRLYTEGFKNVDGMPGPRKRYRGHMNTLEKLRTFEGVDVRVLSDSDPDGCTSSCELYETEPIREAA
jgi:3'-phosphoadenosine 5'-phosphosulfate sulfotransferase (PAPS reductase)/FAD synthetase